MAGTSDIQVSLTTDGAGAMDSGNREHEDLEEPLPDWSKADLKDLTLCAYLASMLPRAWRDFPPPVHPSSLALRLYVSTGWLAWLLLQPAN